MASHGQGTTMVTEVYSNSTEISYDFQRKSVAVTPISGTVETKEETG